MISFHQAKTASEEAEKVRLIKAAANLVKTDIKSVEQSKDIYPTTLEIQCQRCHCFLASIPGSFLNNLFVGKEKGLHVASIGQAVMQATHPRVLILNSQNY